MAEVLSWQNNPDPLAVVRRAVQALGAGGVVAFPTETSYVLAARGSDAAAVERLRGQDEKAPVSFSVAVSGMAQAIELLPGMSPLARRLARRCWPGPVTLLCPAGSEGDAPQLPPPLRAQGELALCCPAHGAILHALRELNTPLVIMSLAATEAPALGDEVALVIDDGPCRYDQPPTVVRVGAGWELVHEGVIPRPQLEIQAACVVLFICTGNTCRSPLAEALCKKKLADRLGCTPDELPQRGFVVLSAGISACDGDEAATAAVAVAREYGADLSQHFSQALDPSLASQADALVCMTQWHLEAVRNYFHDLGCQPRLLSPEGTDLADPIGQEEAVYRGCGEQIWKDLDVLVEELLEKEPRQTPDS
jgi:protein-tyrosine phosphatase